MVSIQDVHPMSAGADLSESARAEALAESKEQWPPASIVGYYAIVDRCHRGLTPDQARLLHAFPALPVCIAAVFWLESSQARAQLFVRDEAHDFGAAADLEILLPWRQISASANSVAAVYQEDNPGLQPLQSLTERRSGVRHWIAAAVAIGLLSTGAGIWFRRAPRPLVPSSTISPIADARGINLRIQRQGPFLKILWDSNSARVKNSQHGTLQITDGLIKSEIELNRAETMQGIFAYEPKTADVDVRLQLDLHGKQNLAESVRMQRALGPEEAASQEGKSSATTLASPTFVLPVRSPSVLPAPPAVATWYAPPGSASSVAEKSRPSGGGRLTDVVSP